MPSQNLLVLGRLATVGQPHVVPVSFRYYRDLDTIDVGGHDFAQRKKYRDVRAHPRHPRVSDDLSSINPWRPRGIEIRGQADVLETGGPTIRPNFSPDMFRIRPRRIIRWGMDESVGELNARLVA